MGVFAARAFRSTATCLASCGKPKLVAVLACLLAAPAAGEELDIGEALGNTEGCEQLTTGQSTSDLWLLLRPDSLEGAVIACTFAEVARAADGSRLVTGLCSHEGEEQRQVRRFVVATDPGENRARLVFEDGALLERFAACE